MPPTDRSGGFWTPTTLAVAVALLLAARFSASTILAGFNLTTETLALTGQILEGRFRTDGGRVGYLLRRRFIRWDGPEPLR